MSSPDQQLARHRTPEPRQPGIPSAHIAPAHWADEGFSMLLVFALALCIALGIGRLMQGGATGSTAEAAPGEPSEARCVAMDRDSLATLQPLLAGERRAESNLDLAVAMHALSIARRHCAYGWIDRAEADYRWLMAWAAEHVTTGAPGAEGRP